MQFDTVPEYEKFAKALKEVCAEKNCHLNDTWDWEDVTNSTTTNTMSSYSDKETRAQVHKSNKEEKKPQQEEKKTEPAK